jgi:plastocyanin
MRRFAIALAAVALAGVAAGCGGGEDEGAVTTTGNQTEAERMDVKGEDIVEVVQHDFFFRPAILVGTPGQEVTIDLKNESAAAHTFTIEGPLAVDEEVQPGDVGQVRITFPESGEVTFICTYHENRGMVGTLEASSSSGQSTTTPTTPTTTSSSDY